jgi:hypothetical protein
MRRPALHPLLAATLVAMACREAPPPRPALRHFLGAPASMIALDHETRIATGAEATPLARGWYPNAAALPAALDVPPSLGRAEWLLLHHRVWEQAQPRTAARSPTAASASEIQRVQRPGVTPVVVPEKLRELAGTAGVRMEVSALPVEPGPDSLRFEIEVQPGTELGLGYALRPEARAARAGAVRFVASVLDAAGTHHTLLETTLDPALPESSRWSDGTFDLQPFAGQRVTLELRTDPVPPAEFALGVWSDPAIYAPGYAPDASGGDSPLPNLVVISLDTLRAKSLGSYGHGRDTSPFLDRIAREGTLFENAIAPATVTGPSHMSLFTGVYPPRHGMLTGMEPKVRGVATVAQLLRAAGYQTTAFTENGYIIAPLGFTDGFSAYRENTGQGWDHPTRRG